jgi:5'-nucleotidase
MIWTATSDDEHQALLDLDGSLADYDAAMRERMEAIRSPLEPPVTDRLASDEDEPPHLEARRKLIQAMPGFWRGLKRIDLGFEVVATMRAIGFGLHVLTKGPRSTPNAWSEKLEWCLVEIPDAMVSVSADKSAVYGRVLLDDWPPYFLSWLKARRNGLVVCVAQPWNTDYRVGGPLHRPDVLRYDGTNKSRLEALLRRAYDRKGGEAFGDV